GSLLAFEDAIDINGGLPELIAQISPVGYQAASGDRRAIPIDRRQFVLSRQRYDQLSMNIANPLPVTISPALAVRPNSVIVRSISLESRILTAMASTPSDGAMAWIAANWPTPPVVVASRMTAARVTLGAISLRSCSHLPPMPNS